MSDMVTISPDQLAYETRVILEEFQRELTEEIKRDFDEAGKVALKKVKETPAGAGKYHDWKDYSKGWRVKAKDLIGGYEVVVYNPRKPGLTHLLEKGHVTSDGQAHTRAFPHIEPAAEAGADLIERRLRNG